uniref:Large ribosomal subunit protein bL19c n=1 Tax=Polysiphonia scopulorum TaxID=257860 RepID=A0A1Z1MHW1_9FLOR|nr:ribosomal protein L19 [Polysiphonia scopulorum]ARW65670.1 ribosomal protein L19 [Polysiphonia scopulorum]
MIIKKRKNIDFIKQVEKDYLKKDLPLLEIGDSIRIKKLIQEGTKERIQISDGVIISKNNSMINQTITVRKTLQNIGVERVYLINSPKIINIEIMKKAKVRRAKLYYLRTRSGKATRLKQKIS